MTVVVPVVAPVLLGMGVDPLQELGLGALLHDIGETRVPEAILKKRYGLTPDETREMQRRVASVVSLSPEETALVIEIAKFFRTGQPPVSAAETLEIYAFMEAADESKGHRQHHQAGDGGYVLEQKPDVILFGGGVSKNPGALISDREILCTSPSALNLGIVIQSPTLTTLLAII